MSIILFNVSPPFLSTNVIIGLKESMGRLLFQSLVVGNSSNHNSNSLPQPPSYLSNEIAILPHGVDGGKLILKELRGNGGITCLNIALGV